MRGSPKRDIAARREHRHTVLRHLGQGPRSGGTLRYDLAVKCGGVGENVGHALNWLRDHGLVFATGDVRCGKGTWHIAPLGTRALLAASNGAELAAWVTMHEAASEYTCGVCGAPSGDDDSEPTACCRGLHHRAIVDREDGIERACS